jgi:arylsulfatase A-like enzyme/Tfp pilus assembly protein PilF
MTRPRSVSTLIFFGVLLAVGVVAWVIVNNNAATARAPRHVVLFTLDTTRADHIGTYGASQARTPHLDSLAALGVRFDDAVTTAPITGPAHAAIFTGQYPARFGVRDNATTPLPERATTLAEHLSASGFATGGFIGAFVLDRAYGFAQGFTTFSGFDRVESGREANAERNGASVVDDALQWLATVPVEQSTFLWVHLYDPHAPYAAPAPFGPEFVSRPYDGEIAYVDHQIGRVLEALKTRGTFDDSLIIAVADHGESLGEHGEDEHGVFLYEPVMRVPLIISGPTARAGHVVTEQVRVIDLVPTTLDLLGLPAVTGLDGESLRTVLDGGTRQTIPSAYAESYYPKLHYGWSELRSLRADGWKVIDAPRPELFAITKDPREADNVFEAQRALGERMVAEAARLDGELTGGQTPRTTAPNRETMERLRSLGYVGTSSPLPTTNGERGPDPKDRIEERRTFKRLLSEAIDDLRAGRLDDSVRKLRDLVRINERAYDLHQLLGEAYERMGRPVEALGEYEMAALLNPVAAAPQLSAAELLLATGQIADARARVDAATTLDPSSFDVALVTGRVLEAEGRRAEAVAAYERAITINPANPRARMLLVGAASRVNRLDLAEQQLQQLITMGYQPSRSHFALGQIAQSRGQVDVAERHYREALRLEPGLAMASEALRRLR